MNNTTLGEFRRLSDEERIGKTVTSPSALMELFKSPRHYYDRHILKNSQEPTAAMLAGTMIHKAVLEREKFFDSYLVLDPKDDYLVTTDDLKERLKMFDVKPKSKKSDLIEQVLSVQPTAKIWDIYLQEVQKEGKTLISAEDYQTCQKVIESVKAHRFLGTLPENRLNEIRGYYQHESGIYISFQLDSLYFTKDDRPIIIEVKKTRDASPRGFAKQIANSGYNVQAAAYVDAVNKITGRNDALFMWVAIEDKSPYIVEVYAAETASLSAGHIQFNKLIMKLQECAENNYWPAYTDGKVNPILLPKWYFEGLEYQAEDELLYNNETQGE